MPEGYALRGQVERFVELAELVRRLLPLSDLDKTGVFDVLRNTTRAVFLGVLLTALVQGTLGGLGFAFVGLPAPVLFAAVTFFAALLPGGTLLVWGPAVRSASFCATPSCRLPGRAIAPRR